MYTKKKILITGGTGSFGKTVLEKFLTTDIEEIRIFSRDEKKQDDMRREFNDSRINYYIGDIRDLDSINLAMKNINYCFHAAALKQVPSCEFFPMEAVKTNILGTENVLNAAIQNNVEKVICLSTDKAVQPINAMGISKAMMEKLYIAKSQIAQKSNTIICGTRYGNVMASRGSVIPKFVEQVEKQQPITITNPEMTRFLMSLDDAVDLVLYAFENGQPGDVFVQKSPSSTIRDLAVAIKNILGVPHHPIKIIGPRHAEKVYETLLTPEEKSRAVESVKYFKVSADFRDMNYEKYLTEGELDLIGNEEYNSHNTKRLDVTEIENMLLSLKELNFNKKEVEIG